jgi:polygalacturonase
MRNARERGAKGDGATDDRAAIQACIDEAGASGGGTVYLPPGGYVSGSLFLRDRVELRLERGAVLLGSLDPRDWPLVESRWEGETRLAHAGLIHASGARDVAVTGGGLIDGRGAHWWERFRSGNLAHPRPRLIVLEGCEGVLLEGFRAENSPSWTVNPVRSRNLRITGISILNPHDSPNTDGINPDSCRGVRISDCFVSVGDDCITIKAGTERERPGLEMACEDIVISNCVLERGHGGVVIGSEMSGGVRNVAISNCVFRGTDRGIRMKTRRGRGGLVERIRVSNIVMDGVQVPFALNARYHCGARGVPLVAAREAQPLGPGTPRFRDIALSGVTATGATLAAAWIEGLAEAPVEGLSLSDCCFRMAGEAEAAPPEMADDLPALSRAGIRARNVRGLRLRGVVVAGQEGSALEAEGCPDRFQSE